MDAAGQVRVFTSHKDARDPLIVRLGAVCSYCEITQPTGAEVEHVEAQALSPSLALTWDNFLLGCRHCNSIKGARAQNLNDYFWPDRDNTFRAFEYTPYLPPQPAPGLGPAEMLRAQQTIALTGLDRRPGHPNYSDRDRRHWVRYEAWEEALRAKQRLDAMDSPQLREQIVATCRYSGFWSVWMTVFAGDADMCRRFREDALPNTALNCWDTAGNVVQRPGGAI